MFSASQLSHPPPAGCCCRLQSKEIERLNKVYTQILKNAGVEVLGEPAWGAPALSAFARMEMRGGTLGAERGCALLCSAKASYHAGVAAWLRACCARGAPSLLPTLTPCEHPIPIPGRGTRQDSGCAHCGGAGQRRLGAAAAHQEYPGGHGQPCREDSHPWRGTKAPAGQGRAVQV